MKQMSFRLTTTQILNRSKTVTRRMGWANLRPGALLQAVEKGQGLKKGETVDRLAVLRVTDVSREALAEGLSPSDVVREGFPALSPREFLEMFCRSHAGCTPTSVVTRIAFTYVDVQEVWGHPVDVETGEVLS